MYTHTYHIEAEGQWQMLGGLISRKATNGSTAVIFFVSHVQEFNRKNLEEQTEYIYIYIYRDIGYRYD